MKLIFLGTGGGRHSAMFQIRSTGGLLIKTEKGNIHIDPGSGALAKMNEIAYDLQTTDAVIITHSHPDHYSDAPGVIEGMTRGGWEKRGSIFCSETVVDYVNGIGPAVSAYHLSLPEKVVTVKAGDDNNIAGTNVHFTKSLHNDPTTFGMIFDTAYGKISYVSDTSFSEDIANQYKGSRILILPLTVPNDMRIKGHMNLDDLVKFIDIVKPELVILNHLGIRTIEVGAENQAKKAQDATDVAVIAAKDLMEVEIGESVIIDVLEGQHHEWLDFW